MTTKNPSEPTTETGATETGTRPQLVVLQGGRTGDDPPVASPDPNISQRERDLNAFMAVQMLLAIEDAKSMPTTAELKRRVDAIMKKTRAKLAEMDAAANAKNGGGDAR